MAHGLQSVGPLGPFWPKSNEAKRGQVGPPEPVLAPNTKRPSGPQVGYCSAHGLWQPVEATSSAPIKDSPQSQGNTLAQLQSRIPLKLRGRLFLPQCTPYSRIQEWCINGIIYHYAPFFLSNPMVTFSGPNYVIPNQVPNPSPISKKDVLAIWSGNSLVATRRPFKDPNHLALQELGCQFSSGPFSGKFSEVINHFNHFQGIKYSEFLGKLNWSIQVEIKHPVWPWPIWSNSYSTVGIQSHS
ncbi:hypothetical protein O181_100594 [Austropuccinia psidii MF-1]|uniref:Uncharacterized protein n=1 Tax=Austropuccinia psidii MF-1 TaxID=1389203 RepID=A0A9Q3JEX5_9BASI|nr:hypothetical protein [Austropuccinia psidii MF-1]